MALRTLNKKSKVYIFAHDDWCINVKKATLTIGEGGHSEKTYSLKNLRNIEAYEDDKDWYVLVGCIETKDMFRIAAGGDNRLKLVQFLIASA